MNVMPGKRNDRHTFPYRHDIVLVAGVDQPNNVSHFYWSTCSSKYGNKLEILIYRHSIM